MQRYRLIIQNQIRYQFLAYRRLGGVSVSACA